jgi:hypothetical protein
VSNSRVEIVDFDFEVEHLGLLTRLLWPYRWFVPLPGREIDTHQERRHPCLVAPLRYVIGQFTSSDGVRTPLQVLGLGRASEAGVPAQAQR